MLIISVMVGIMLRCCTNMLRFRHRKTAINAAPVHLCFNKRSISALELGYPSDLDPNRIPDQGIILVNYSPQVFCMILACSVIIIINVRVY
jgi:hypothetical protein